MLAFLVLGFQSLQEADLLGLTPRQVVALGSEKWSEKHGDAHGYSTMAMADMSQTFGLCMEEVNNQDFPVNPKARAVADRLRPLMSEGAFAIHEALAITSGGGSMWRLFNASVLTAREEALTSLLKPRTLNHKVSQEQVWAIYRQLASSKAELPEFTQNYEKERYRPALAEFSSAFYRAMQASAGLTSNQRQSVIEFFYKSADLGRMIAGEDLAEAGRT
jgi:hypothetical protein